MKVMPMLMPLIMNLAVKLISDKVQKGEKEKFLADIETHLKDYLLKNDSLIAKIKDKVESIEQVLAKKAIERKNDIVKRVKDQTPDFADVVIDLVTSETDSLIKETLNFISDEIKSMIDGIIADSRENVNAIPEQVKTEPKTQATTDRRRKFDPYLYIK